MSCSGMQREASDPYVYSRTWQQRPWQSGACDRSAEAGHALLWLSKESQAEVLMGQAV